MSNSDIYYTRTCIQEQYENNNKNLAHAEVYTLPKKML